MGAIIEAFQVNQHPETATHSGVVCIFCGLPTPVHTSGEGTLATHVPRANHRVSIVRCEVCGKEAPYHAHEITEFGEIFHEASGILWFAKDAV
jgi:hypothetical protein